MKTMTIGELTSKLVGFGPLTKIKIAGCDIEYCHCMADTDIANIMLTKVNGEHVVFLTKPEEE